MVSVGMLGAIAGGRDVNEWTAGQDLEIIQHRSFQTFSQMKCYVKAEYVKTCNNEAYLVGARAEVCGRLYQYLADWSFYSLSHLFECESSDKYSQKLKEIIHKCLLRLGIW